MEQSTVWTVYKSSVQFRNYLFLLAAPCVYLQYAVELFLHNLPWRQIATHSCEHYLGGFRFKQTKKRGLSCHMFLFVKTKVPNKNIRENETTPASLCNLWFFGCLYTFFILSPCFFRAFKNLKQLQRKPPEGARKEMTPAARSACQYNGEIGELHQPQIEPLPVTPLEFNMEPEN